MQPLVNIFVRVFQILNFSINFSGIPFAIDIDSLSFLNRFTLRNQAKDWFFEVIDEVDSYTGEEPIPDNLILDLNAGLAYTYSSLALYNEFDPYMLTGSTEEFVANALNYSGLVISEDSNYIFTFSPENINSNNLRVLRAQLFLQI